jgi:hypothetical protein
MSSTNPLGHQELRQLRQAPRGERQAMLSGPGLGGLLDLPALRQGELRGRPPRYLGYSDLNPSAFKLWITSRTRSWLVNATFTIATASMPCADSSTICARRQVTTGPVSAISTCSRSAPPARRRRADVTCYGNSAGLLAMADLLREPGHVQAGARSGPSTGHAHHSG